MRHRRGVTVGPRSALAPRDLALVAGGGACGAATRWAVVTLTETGGEFPWWTLLVNVVGCALLGLLLGCGDGQRLAVGVGFCGGLTTFSTFAVEIAGLVDVGSTATATLYLGASLGLGVAAVFVGWRLAPAR